jgi:hypothetical protein
MNSGQVFVLAIIAISTFGWVVKSWIRARHGYPLEDDKGGTSQNIAASRKMELLSDENGRLKNQVGRLEERIAVLERIVTDRSRSLSDEIDALR